MTATFLTVSTMTKNLDKINTFLDNHFHEEFLSQEYLAQFDNQQEAKEVFEEDFEYRYNSDEGFNIDLNYIISKCNYLTTMKICEFVSEKYEEHGMSLETSLFGLVDKILKTYIYFYMDEKHKNKFIQEIEEYAFDDEPEPEPSQ